MFTEFKKQNLYSIYEIEWKQARLKSYYNDKQVWIFVFDKWPDWFEKEWRPVHYSRIEKFIW